MIASIMTDNRVLNANFKTKLDTQYGSLPFNVLKVNFPSTTKYFSNSKEPMKFVNVQTITSNFETTFEGWQRMHVEESRKFEVSDHCAKIACNGGKSNVWASTFTAPFLYKLLDNDYMTLDVYFLYTDIVNAWEGCGIIFKKSDSYDWVNIEFAADTSLPAKKYFIPRKNVSGMSIDLGAWVKTTLESFILRIVKNLNSYTLYYSPIATTPTWTLLGSVADFDLGDSIYFGFYVKAGNSTTANAEAWVTKIVETKLVYADVDADANILNMSGLDTQVNNNGNSINQISFTIDDSNGELKELIDSADIHKSKCYFYQAYKDLVYTDWELLATGELNGPIVWKDQDRSLSFDMISKIKSEKIGLLMEYEGQAITVGSQVGTVPRDSIGKIVPIAFGSVSKMPTTTLMTSPVGTLKTTITPLVNSIEIENGIDFTGVTKIVINGQIFEGTFSGDTFTITGRYKDMTGQFENRLGGDAQIANPSVAYSTKNITGCVIGCCVAGSPQINRCNKVEFTGSYVEGKPLYRCWFDKAWSWTLSLSAFAGCRQLPPVYVTNPSTSMPTIQAGATVYDYNYFDGTKQVKYAVCQTDYVSSNQFTYSDVTINTAVPVLKGVYAVRTVLGEKRLCPVPITYYREATENVTIGSTTVSAKLLVLDRPLSQYREENWDDQIYVSFDSPNSPKISEVLEYLLTKYTNLSATLSDAGADLYPACFAILDSNDAITYCYEIAKQARCGIQIHNNVATLKYLSKHPDPILSIDNGDIIEDSVAISFSDVESVITKLTGTWHPNYYDKERKIIKEANQTKYGINEQTMAFNIYNIEACVDFSLQFYINRLSNCWRTIGFETIIKTLGLKALDCLNIDLSLASPVASDSIIESVTKNEYDLSYLCTLPMIAGSTSQSSLFWLTDSISPAYPVETLLPDYLVRDSSNPYYWDGKKQEEEPEDVSMADTEKIPACAAVAEFATPYMKQDGTQFYGVIIDLYENGYDKAATSPAYNSRTTPRVPIPRNTNLTLGYMDWDMFVRDGFAKIENRTDPVYIHQRGWAWYSFEKWHTSDGDTVRAILHFEPDDDGIDIGNDHPTRTFEEDRSASVRDVLTMSNYSGEDVTAIDLGKHNVSAGAMVAEKGELDINDRIAFLSDILTVANLGGGTYQLALKCVGDTLTLKVFDPTALPPVAYELVFTKFTDGKFYGQGTFLKDE